MSELQQNPEEYKRPVWDELVEAALEIDQVKEFIDSSGSEFLGQDEIISKIKQKYNWDKKWAQMSDLEKAHWTVFYKEKKDAKAKQTTQKIKPLSDYYGLAVDYSKKVGNAAGLNSGTKFDKKYLTKLENEFYSGWVSRLSNLKTHCLEAGKDQNGLKDTAIQYVSTITKFVNSPEFNRLHTKTQEKFINDLNFIESQLNDADAIYQFLERIINSQIEVLLISKPL